MRFKVSLWNYHDDNGIRIRVYNIYVAYKQYWIFSLTVNSEIPVVKVEKKLFEI